MTNKDRRKAYASQYARGIRKHVNAKAVKRSPADDYEREVLRIGKAIGEKERKRRELKRQAEFLTRELRALRRGLKTLLWTKQQSMQPFELASEPPLGEGPSVRPIPTADDTLATFDEDRLVTAAEDRIEAGQARWAETGRTR